MSELILFIFELVGIAAFAASGAMRALAKKMDIFGVATLGVITAVGGGALVVVVLRLLAARIHWSLPKADTDPRDTGE